MTSQDLEAMKAAFLARGGTVHVEQPGLAYGVSAEADKAKRKAERERRQYEGDEQDAERRMERVREAYHTGGRSAAIDALND